jgi:hypothetical protein
MSDDDMEQKVKALLGASQEDSDTTHDIALDALHEKDFITFFQLMSEEQVSRDDVLGMCGLWSDFRSATDVIKCKEREIIYAWISNTWIGCHSSRTGFDKNTNR